MTKHKKKLVGRGRIFYRERESRLKATFPCMMRNGNIFFIEINGCAMSKEQGAGNKEQEGPF